MPYDPTAIEPKWQAIWRETKAFRTPPRGERPKYYVLDMFPYPSGQGLHVGHLKGYVASDVIARFKRMRGFDVLHPMGWDSFGLPTERQAEREGIPAAQVTSRNIATFRRQLELVGLSYDWEREIATSDPTYYRWTQWIFVRLLEMGLAYQAEGPVNWCPALGTVLANEEVKDGRYVETGDPVERRVMRQWMLRITAYADRLLDDLETVDWPEEVKELQRNWIGRRAGATITFSTTGGGPAFEVFSTRPETLFGASFCALAPEHPLALAIATADRQADVRAYARAAAGRSERDRIARTEGPSGVFTGAFATNPANGAALPVWVSEYVLASYGTGAVFGCPAHDQRDFEFAKRFGLPVVRVVEGGGVAEAAYEGHGRMVGSSFLDGLSTEAARARMIEHLEGVGAGRAAVTYHLRDWLFSRQRYWGEPIPVVHGPRGEVEPAAELPVRLPDLAARREASDGDAPRSPLDSARDWVRTPLPSTGEAARRETNVMPQWAGSSWYYLRFLDPRNDEAPWDPAADRAWMPVDLYVGGIEHAVLHLLYARFWHKVFYDLGLVSTVEPFQRLFNQGMVHSRSFKDLDGRYYYPDHVYERDGEWYTRDGDAPVASRMEKMSKSRYNVVPPEPVVEEFGADAVRLYELFMGPVEGKSVWQADGLPGTRRFLERVWRIFEASAERSDVHDDDETERLLHRTIKKVTDDLEELRLNTAVSQLMIFANHALARGGVSTDALSRFVRLLAPFAPHACEEMWQAIGGRGLVAHSEWPTYDAAKCREEAVTVAVQVNGKLRARVECPASADEDAALAAALENHAVRQWIDGKRIARVVYVPARLLNIVVS